MNLSNLESRLQELVEIEIPGLLPRKDIHAVIIQKLSNVIQSHILSSRNNTPIAPDTYTILLHPNSANLLKHTHLLTTLLSSIKILAQERGFQFIISPTISIAEDSNLPENDAEVIASNRVSIMDDTNGTPLDKGSLDENNVIPENAFLIVEGVKVFPLSQSVINIGRRLDNQLVIDDPRVSRNHAQLRAIKGRYVVFDLNSTGGTFVNGQRASQSVLYPGDVISLAGVTLIFGQDNPPPRPDLKDTAPLQSAAADRRTAFLDDQSTDKNLKKP